MRLPHALLKLLLLATVVLDLGGGAWAVRAMVGQAQPVATTAHAPQATPCHGDVASDPVVTALHDHANAECGSAQCDCGCAVNSATATMLAVVPAPAAPEARLLGLGSQRIPDDFTRPGLRPPIRA